MDALIGLGLLFGYAVGGAFTCGLFGAKNDDGANGLLFFGWPLVLAVVPVIWLVGNAFAAAFGAGRWLRERCS